MNLFTQVAFVLSQVRALVSARLDAASQRRKARRRKRVPRFNGYDLFGG